MSERSSLVRSIVKKIGCLAIGIGFVLVAPLAGEAEGSVPAAPAQVGKELRVGIFLDADSMPLLVAESKGLFAKEGVAVKLVAFQNPVERDAALQAGAVDGAVSDLLAATLAVQSGFDLRVTSLTDGRYGIVSAPGSGLASLSQLRGVQVGVSTNSIIQYATETMLGGAGLAPADIQVIAVPKMPVRLELLVAGQIKAACLPEPLLSAATARGASLLATSDGAAGISGGSASQASGFGAGVLLFTKKALDENLPAIQAFYRAYAAGAAAINADNDGFRPFLAQALHFPADLTGSYRFVVYKKPRLPSDADVAKVFSWLASKGLLKAPRDAASLLDGRAIAGL
jgi:NitT/TauT family transport system substrate-binding protein